MQLVKALLSLVIPISCLNCARDGEIICGQCRAQYSPSQLLPPKLVDQFDSECAIGTLLPYDESVSRIILGAKDGGNRQLEEIVVTALLAARCLFPGDLALIPIPSTARAKRRRGRDFTFDLARAISLKTGDQVIRSLRYTRTVAPQKSLNARERAINMRGALICSENPMHQKTRVDKPALLLDDVLTTGATIEEGIRAIRSAGRPCLGAITASFSLNWSQGQPQR